MQETMMDTKAVADLLGISICTVYRLKDKPDGLRAYRVGRCIRFKRCEVEKYLSDHVIEPVYNKNGFHGVRFRYVPGMKVV